VSGDMRAQLVAKDLSALAKETRGQDWREVPEGAMLTHEQALARFRTWTFDQQLRYLSGLRDLAEEAARCHMMDHDGAVQDAQRLAIHNSELRDRLDQLLRGGKVSTGGDNAVDIAGVYLTTEQVAQIREEATAEGRRQHKQEAADRATAFLKQAGITP
jgi:hypothetical protein